MEILKFIVVILTLQACLVIVKTSRDLVFRCQFDILIESDELLVNLTQKDLPHLPKLIRPKLYASKYPEMNFTDYRDIIPPAYPIHVVSLLRNARINLMAGAIFDKRGCIAKHNLESQDWKQRLRFLSTEPIDIYKNALPDHFPVAIYLWGSVFNRDWQHAVIDLLPLLNLALPWMMNEPNIPIIVGNYISFFKDLFPFNRLNFIDRDYKFRFSAIGRDVLTSFDKVYVVDIIHRRQSYVIPGSYARILPLLWSDLQFESNQMIMPWSSSSLVNTHRNRNNSNQSTTVDRIHSFFSLWLDSLSSNFLEYHRSNDLWWELIQYSNKHSFQPWHSQSVTTRKKIVFLDRVSLITNRQYASKIGKITGRLLSEQNEIIEQLRLVLAPQYELVVHACMNWKEDRQIMAQAHTILGPHGGHFTNMIFAQKGTNIIEFGRNSILRQLYPNPIYVFRNGRWVFAGLSNALDHSHWFVEDIGILKEIDDQYREMKKLLNKFPRMKIKPFNVGWQDQNITIDRKQLWRTMKRLGLLTALPA